jgi:hypothetical protein
MERVLELPPIEIMAEKEDSMIGKDTWIKDYSTLLIICIIAAFAIFFLNYERLFTTQEIKISIHEKSLPRQCINRSSIFQGPKGRSSKPKAELFGYCGVIKTNLGYYNLPETQRVPSLDASREQLYDSIEEGCSYTIDTYGFSKLHAEGDLPKNRANRTVLSILARHGCGSD